MPEQPNQRRPSRGGADFRSRLRAESHEQAHADDHPHHHEPNYPDRSDIPRNAPDLIAERAREFLKANKDHPFFLYFPTTVPHLALQVPEDSLKEYEGQFPDEPYTGDRDYLPIWVGEAVDLINEVEAVTGDFLVRPGRRLS